MSAKSLIRYDGFTLSYSLSFRPHISQIQCSFICINYTRFSNYVLFKCVRVSCTFSELCCLTAAVKVADTGNNGEWQQHAVYVLRFVRRSRVRSSCRSATVHGYINYASGSSGRSSLSAGVGA